MKDVNKIRLDLLKIKKGSNVLDIGCSSGDQAMKIAEQGVIVFGIDESEKLIKEFIQKAKQINLKCFPKVGDATKMPFSNSRFDGVIATEVFEHIPNVKKAISESYRVLISGGRICVSVPTKVSEKIFIKIHPYWLKDSGHVNFYSKKEITNLLKNAGFKIEKVESLNFEWSLFWLIHSMFKTRFDSTGSPLENYEISNRYSKIWGYLFKIRIGKFLLWIGNRSFPKSYYIYAKK